ncbi:hypothetical protein B5X24_HaOG212680 [Helicoverpa armigera]|nr:hypothetical protein B5X24_HaOG212680 [Helicoverpa armigera]
MWNPKSPASLYHIQTLGLQSSEFLGGKPNASDYEKREVVHRCLVRRQSSVASRYSDNAVASLQSCAPKRRRTGERVSPTTHHRMTVTQMERRRSQFRERARGWSTLVRARLLARELLFADVLVCRYDRIILCTMQ